MVSSLPPPVRAGLSLRAAAELCGVGLKTYMNWENGKHAPPAAAPIDGDRLCTDTGLSFKIGEIRYLEFVWKRLAGLKDENERLKKRLKERTPLIPCRRRHGE